MRQYGFNKATEFSKKQINVIWAKAKNGELKVERWYMERLYDLADYYGYDSNGSVEWAERSIKRILDAVFENDLQKAQKLIDFDQTSAFELYGRKNQAKCDKSIVA